MAKPRTARLLLGMVGMVGLWIGLPAPAARAETAGPKPIARATPEYPRAALRNGIEGSVLLEFSVDRHGRVVAPRVIDATPSGVFDGAALEAVSRWKYQALGTESANLKVRLTFRIGDQPPSVGWRIPNPTVPAAGLAADLIPSPNPAAAPLRPAGLDAAW